MAIKKILKITLTSIIAIIISLSIIATLVVRNLDQEIIKNKATQLVREQTGRKLNIEGDISWTLYPWLGAKIKNISLDNPNNFGKGVFAKIDELGIGIKLLPLIFKKSIEGDHLTIKGLKLNLITSASNKNNWQDLTSTKKKIPSRSTKKQEKNPEQIKLAMNNITIINGAVIWQDQKINKKITIENLNLSSKHVSLKKPFNLTTSFNIYNLNNFLNGTLTAQTKVNLDPAKNTYELKDLALETPNADASGFIQVKNGDASGNLIITSTNENGITKLLNIKPKAPLDSSFKITTEFSSNKIKMPIIKAKFANMTLEGSANYIGSALAFDLKLNKLDLNILNKNLSDNDTAKTKTKANTNQNNRSLPTKNDKSPIKLNGNLQIGEIKFNKMALSDFNTKITGNSNLINCQNINFELYKKNALGSANINLSSSIPQLNTKLSVKGLPLKSLLKDSVNYDKFSGNLSFSANLVLKGNTVAQLMASLGGNGKVAIDNGSYQGIDIPYEVRRAHAILNSKPMPQKTKPPHTDFDKLTMRFNAKNGVMSTKNLLVKSPDYRVTGKGKANLESKQLNVMLEAYSVNDKNFFLPIKVTGTFDDPSVMPDTSVLLRREATKAVSNVIEKHVGKDFEKLKDILPLDKLLR